MTIGHLYILKHDKGITFAWRDVVFLELPLLRDMLPKIHTDDPLEEKIQELCIAYEKRNELRREANKHKNHTQRRKDALVALCKHTSEVIQLEREVGIL